MITTKSFEGSHELIKQGAHIVTSARDILVQYGVASEEASTPARNFSSPGEEKIFAIIADASQGMSIDDIIDASGMTSADVSMHLSVLSLAGIIKELYGMFFIQK